MNIILILHVYDDVFMYFRVSVYTISSDVARNSLNGVED